MKKVFVYGDFNILHPGHLRLLKFAKESGDYLSVGVLKNNLSTKSNLLDEKFRLESVKATSYVDEAFLLDEDPTEYIKIHKPDIVVKGKEHQNKENKELEELESYGGKLLFTSGEISFSSLDLIKKEFFDTASSKIVHDTNYLKRHNISRESLTSLLDSFKEKNILVIGDSIVDEYITCEALGMSQEDPTIVVSPLSNDKFIGGAAIVAAHASSLGSKVNYISVVGNDDNYEYIENSLNKLNIKTHLLKDTTRPTTTKQRFRASNKTLLRVNNLKRHDIGKDIEEKILDIMKEKISKIDMIIFSDFSYGVITERILTTLIKMSKKYNVILTADSQSSSQIGDISKFLNMDLVTPTEREIRLALNDFNSGLVVLSEKLVTKSNPKYILTTLGNEGVLIYNTNKDELLTDKVPALSNIVKDVSGAGDSLLTCASLALSVGANIWESTYLGSIASAIQVSRVGNIPIKFTDIKKELNSI